MKEAAFDDVTYENVAKFGIRVPTSLFDNKLRSELSERDFDVIQEPWQHEMGMNFVLVILIKSHAK